MQPLDFCGVTMATGHSGLVAGTTTTHTITTAFSYSVRGKSGLKAAASNIAAVTTDANTGVAFLGLTANKGCVFVWCVNLAGTTSIVQGPIIGLSGEADGANATFNGFAPQFGDIPITHCPFGYTVVKVGASGSTWTMGTSNNSSVSNVSIAFVSLLTLTDRAQVS